MLLLLNTLFVVYLIYVRCRFCAVYASSSEGTQVKRNNVMSGLHRALSGRPYAMNALRNRQRPAERNVAVCV
jgi:hypothetical protein